MSAVRRQIAEARATAIVLHATARACRGFDGPMRFRLNRAADALDSMVLLAVRSLRRAKRLARTLREIKGGGQ